MAETDSVMVFNLQYHLMTLAHYLVFVSHDSQAQEWGWLDLVVMINVSNSTGEPAPHVVSLNQVLINIIQKHINHSKSVSAHLNCTFQIYGLLPLNGI